MNSNQYEGIVIAIAAIVFSLLILAIFFYRIYLMINGNGDQSADEVENEAHFLFKCPILRHLRKIYLEPQINSIPGFEFFPDNFKLKAFMTDMKYDTCKFIANATELRNFLALKPRTIG